jgi:hypothetical protein
MNINDCKKYLFPLFAFLIVFYGGVFQEVGAETNIYNISNSETYNSLNFETKNFVGRLNQLPQNFTFDKNLKRGTPVSPDVQYLKWILNSDTRTALTDNPNMTLTELTSAFGPITESAVKRFQTVYKSEILDPQGITSATGVVGKGTRQKLNSLLSKSRVFINNTNNTNTSVNNTNYYNNSNYNTNTNRYVDFSNIENFINGGRFIQTQTNSTSSQWSTSTGTSTNSGTSSQSTRSTSTASTTSGGNTVKDDEDSAAGSAAIIAGAILVGMAADSAAEKAVNTMFAHFGGTITMNMPCPCSANYMITLSDISTKMPLSIMFQPGVSSIKMNYNPTMGETVMGGYIKGAATCMVYVGSGCSSYGNPSGTIDSVRGIGTTLTPAK